MPFLPNIPLATDQISTSQANLLTNFTILGAIAGNVNASSDSININSGFNWIYLPTNAAAIPPAGAAFPAGELGIYSATSPFSAKNELYVNKTNQATVVQVPMTESILSAASAPAIGSTGYTYLPSGLILKWGTVAVVAQMPLTNLVNVNAAGPALTSIIQVQLTGLSPSPAPHLIYEFAPSLIGVPTATTFTFGSYWGGIAGQSVYWLVIGY